MMIRNVLGYWLFTLIFLKNDPPPKNIAKKIKNFVFELGVIYDIYDIATCWARQWNKNIKMCTDFSELDFIPNTHKRPNGLSIL